MSILNHYQLLRLYGAGGWRHIGVALSVLCWIAWSTAKGLRRGLTAKGADFKFARGQFSALKTLLTGRSPYGLEPHPEAGNE